MRLYREVQPVRRIITAAQVITAMLGCLMLLGLAQWVARVSEVECCASVTVRVIEQLELDVDTSLGQR